jgi:hypothetical protein
MTAMASRGRSAAALATAVSLMSAPVAADCTCRALGGDFEIGRVVCLATHKGPRVATCSMVLNNTSWHISETACDPADNVARANEAAASSVLSRLHGHPVANVSTTRRED